MVGLAEEDHKVSVLQQFVKGDIHIMVCTASGSTGINPSPSLVITDGPVLSVLQQVQQNFRCCRYGEPGGRCIQFYSYDDYKSFLLFLLATHHEKRETYRGTYGEDNRVQALAEYRIATTSVDEFKESWNWCCNVSSCRHVALRKTLWSESKLGDCQSFCDLCAQKRSSANKKSINITTISANTSKQILEFVKTYCVFTHPENHNFDEDQLCGELESCNQFKGISHKDVVQRLVALNVLEHVAIKLSLEERASRRKRIKGGKKVDGQKKLHKEKRVTTAFELRLKYNTTSYIESFHDLSYGVPILSSVKLIPRQNNDDL